MTEGEFPHLELMKYDLFPRKLDPPLWPELRKGSDIELLTPKAYCHFHRHHINPVSIKSQTFLVNSIFSSSFKWSLLSFKNLSVSTVTVRSMKVIPRSPPIVISWMFTSCALLFRLLFGRTISDMVIAFFSHC